MQVSTVCASVLVSLKWTLSSYVAAFVPKWSSAGHVAIYEGSVLGSLIGYVSGHQVVASKEEAATYIYRAHGSGGDLYDIVCLLKLSQIGP